jgi:penicillin-binding protein 1A
MVTAVRNRPIEPFETEVPMPDWQLEPEEELYALPYEEPGSAPLVDADGNPLPSPDPVDGRVNPPARPDGAGVEQQWLDDVFGREGDRPAPPQPAPQRVPPTRLPGPGSVPAPDPPQPRPQPTQ